MKIKMTPYFGVALVLVTSILILVKDLNAASAYGLRNGTSTNPAYLYSIDLATGTITGVGATLDRFGFDFISTLVLPIPPMAILLASGLQYVYVIEATPSIAEHISSTSTVNLSAHEFRVEVI